ncbi:MAG: hypothetical protein R2760_06020 [Chitinophagales bacterium]
MFSYDWESKPHSAARNDMKNGYNIHWTDNALDELEKTIEYLTDNFTDREIKTSLKNRRYHEVDNPSKHFSKISI